ncbi:MAG: TIGR04086 family membrane protein [Clostridiales bacterium]|jgi:putative membrane protein (TIGR04086 family)|nr:TIGR04086 family membrane protein [Clostridiales bacterium]
MSFAAKIKRQRAPKTVIDEGAKTVALEVTKALAVAVSLTLALILLFALVIGWLSVPEAAIMPVNQGIKAISLLAGSLFSFRVKKGGWKKGLLLGILYVVAAFIIFSLMSGSFSFTWMLAVDAALGTVMGVICGIIAVNVRKSA